MPNILVVVSAVICAYIAYRRGRNPVVWALLGVFMNVFAILLLFILPDLKALSEVKITRDAETGVIDVTPAETMPNLGIDSAAWYYVDEDQQQQGPMSAEDLRQLWKSGTLKELSYVWSDGMGDWQKIVTLPELHQMLRS